MIKIKILRGKNYYFFSRFLLANKLQFIKISEKDAVRIAMNMKKKLASEQLFDVPEEKFEEILYEMLNEGGFSKQIDLYQVHSKTKPFLILLAGPPGIGLSSFTTLYASSLCVSNIVPTSLVYNTMKITKPGLWDPISRLSPMSIEKYQAESRFVRKGTFFDILKVQKDGKSLILEGSFIQPLLYTKADENGVPVLNTD